MIPDLSATLAALATVQERGQPDAQSSPAYILINNTGRMPDLSATLAAFDTLPSRTRFEE